METARRIERRTLIKGATAVGGAVWALPLVESLTVTAAGATSGLKQPLPGSAGVRWSPFGAGIVALCTTITDDRCLANTADPSVSADRCGNTSVQSFDGTTLIIDVLGSFHMAEGSADSPAGCFPAVPAPTVGIVAISERWAFSANGAPFTANMLIVPAP